LNKLILLITLGFLTSCGSVIKNIDSIGFNNRSEYQKATTLPPLEIAPELAQSATPETR